MDFFRLLYSQSIFFPQVKWGRILRFSSSFSPFLCISVIYCILSNYRQLLGILILLCFSLTFSVISLFLMVWMMTGFPLQKYTHYTTGPNHTNACVIVQKKLWWDLCKSLFYSVYVIVKGVCWWERSRFPRRRRVFMRLQLCSSLRGYTSCLWSQGFCGKHAKFFKVLRRLVSFHFGLTSGFTFDKMILTKGGGFNTFTAFISVLKKKKM